MPDFDDLRHEFDAQPTPPEDRMLEIATLVRQRSDRLESVLDKRDHEELVATVLVGVVFAVFAVVYSNPVARAGCFIVIVGCIEIAVLMKLARRPAVEDPLSLSLGDMLGHEILMVNRQIALLRHVAWWYLLPLYVGTCVFVASDGWIWFTGIYAVGYFYVCFKIWQANQTARRVELEPLRDRLIAARQAVIDPEAPGIDHDEVVRELSQDTFDHNPGAASATPPPTEPTPKDVLHAAWKCFDAIITMVFMFWGGALAGGMIDAWLAGKPIDARVDGVWTVVVSLLAAIYSLCTKPVRVSVLWGNIKKTEDKNQDESRSS